MLEAEEHGKSLNEDEILAVWRAASSIGGPFGGLVRMGLLTGLRRERARRHAMGLDRPRRAQDHRSGQGDEERPRARGSNHPPDRQAAGSDPRPRRRPRVSRANNALAERRRCRAGRR